MEHRTETKLGIITNSMCDLVLKTPSQRCSDVEHNEEAHTNIAEVTRGHMTRETLLIHSLFVTYK